MPEISLTTFVDFVLASGTPRITCVRNAKEMYRQQYDRRFDFWLLLRSAIQELHRKNLDKKELIAVLGELNDKKKIVAYEKCVAAYQKWMGKRRFQWTGCESTAWASGDLSVRVNPELGLSINGEEHAVKLYFKAQEPSRRRLDTTLYLISVALGAFGNNACPAILDVQRGKLFPAGKFPADIGALLAGEAAALSTMWAQV